MFACVLTRATRDAPHSFATSDALLTSLTPYAASDAQGQWSDDRILMVQALTWNTPTSRRETVPEQCARTGRVIISWVRLDNRDALCAALGLEDRDTLTDPQIILAAHGRWGTDCAKQLEGDFSFVIYDAASQTVFCARDSMGARPFYYVLTDEVFIAATSLPAVRAVIAPVSTISEKWLALFVANMNWAQTETAYEGANKLAPAHHMTVTREGAPEPSRYFEFDLTSPYATTRDPVWVDRYRDVFDRAVADRARSDYLVGAESSAGLDSSSIVAKLVEVLPHAKDDFHCFGMAQMGREPSLLLETAALCDVRHSHTLTRSKAFSFDDGFDRALRTIGHPPEHGQMLFHPSFFAMSEQFGIRTMVSGYGGDEIVTCFAAEMFDELHAHGAFATLYRELPGNSAQRLGRLAKRLWRGLPDPFESERRALGSKLAASCLRDDVLVDGGIAAQVEEWGDPDGLSHTMNTRTGLLPGFTNARAARLESSAIFAASHGVEYRWPLLDRRLIQQFFATPAIEKRHRDRSRYLHRRAMQGRIPDQILWQKTKDMGLHLGGRPNVADRIVSDFSDLPEGLRDLVDPKKYGMLIERSGGRGASALNMDLRATFGLWQVDQLAFWLNGTR